MFLLQYLKFTTSVSPELYFMDKGDETKVGDLFKSYFSVSLTTSKWTIYQLINDSMLFSFRSGQFLFIPGQNLMTSGYDLLS